MSADASSTCQLTHWPTYWSIYSAAYQPTLNRVSMEFGRQASWFVNRCFAKGCLNYRERRSDLGSTSDWLKEISFTARPIKSITQWVVRHHQYWICALSSHVILQGKQWRCHKMLAVFSGCNKFLRSNYMYRVKNILHLYENIEEANVKTHSKPGTGYGFSHFYSRKLAV